MDVFTAVADPTRRSIIEMLANAGELSATDISERFQITPPAISQHLKVLRDSNLVRVEKRAQQRIYQINPAGIHELEEWTEQMSQKWNDRFDQLVKVLKDEKKKTGKKHGR